ncbi:uncharacterized protein LOC135393192 [Ornithodoros turicata]|uniref:uncharacterized protein LOC135393192 n=1 Tax=Ornithodoros turicata TaxID=34597 RepID=UPI003139C516
MQLTSPPQHTLLASESTAFNTNIQPERSAPSRTSSEVMKKRRIRRTPQQQIEELRRKLNLAYKKIRKLEKKVQALESDSRGHLSRDQLVCIQNTDMRGNMWSEETIKKALHIRLSCGRGGYAFLRDSKSLPLPCERVLLKRIAGIKFAPGILEELLPALECKVKTMAPSERHAVLLVDEMQLTPGLDYDSSTKTVIGYSSIRLSEKSSGAIHATHGLVLMLAGLSSRWKQTVGYHFTGDSVSPAMLKEVIFTTIAKCEAIGLTVDAIISDMGSASTCQKMLLLFTSFQLMT